MIFENYIDFLPDITVMIVILFLAILDVLVALDLVLLITLVPAAVMLIYNIVRKSGLIGF